MKYETVRKRLGQWLCVVVLAWLPPAIHAQGLALWQQPGVHAVMRHATAPGFGDPPGFQLGDCSTQRNLDKVGLQEARSWGERIRMAGISPTQVLSSQWCRCVDTAEALGLGPVKALPTLNSFFQNRNEENEKTTGLKRHLASLGPHEKVLYVTHQVNITALTGVFPQSGELVLIRLNPIDLSVSVVGRFQAD